jgi:hypothetical protein
MSKVAAAIVLVVFAAGAAKWFIPSLTVERQTVASTPSLQGLFVRSEVLLRKGSRACIAPVPLDRSVHEVQMLLNARGGVASPIDVTLRGPGYSANTTFSGYLVGGDHLATGRLSASPQAASDGQLCLRNRGRHAVGLVGTTEGESLTPPATTIDGKPVNNMDPALTFLTGKQQSITSEAGTIVDRASGFTDALPAWLLWPLAVLFVLGLPLGAAAIFVLPARRS